MKTFSQSWSQLTTGLDRKRHADAAIASGGGAAKFVTVR